MTDEQLAVALKHVEPYTRDVLKYSAPNMKFIKVRCAHNLTGPLHH